LLKDGWEKNDCLRVANALCKNGAKPPEYGFDDILHTFLKKTTEGKCKTEAGREANKLQQAYKKYDKKRKRESSVEANGKRKCLTTDAQSAVTTKCIYHEDVTLYNGIDDVKCLGQPENKSKKTAWARMRQGIDLLDRVVNKDSDTREKLVQTKTQLPSEQTYFPSPSRCVNIKLANQSAAAGVEQKGIMCPNCFQRCIEKFLDGSD
jgi:hypothetical protein